MCEISLQISEIFKDLKLTNMPSIEEVTQGTLGWALQSLGTR